MADKKLKFLVPMDCSEQAQDTVHYLSGVLAGSKAEVVLFHVLSKLPASFYNMGDAYVVPRKYHEIAQWDWHLANQSHLALEKAVKTLLDAGLPEGLVTTVFHDQKEGIASDIIKECAKGYTAVVIGRKGTSPLKDLVLGSTATKLVNTLQHLPTWVVGGRPETKAYLLGTDGSEGSLGAAEFLGRFIAPKKDTKVGLVYVARKMAIQFGLVESGVGIAEVEEVWRESSTKRGNEALKQAEKILLQTGVDQSRISQNLITDALSRSGALLEEAEKAGCGTIVLGRRGMSKIEAFFMGRVTNKVLSLAKDKAVWIIH